VDFSLNEEQQTIRDAIQKHCAQFSPEYWLEHDRSAEFPHHFYKSLVDAGWLGIATPTEFAFEACHTAMLTLGGMGYAQEYHVEHLLREVLIPRTAPISPHMILSFLAEKVLDLPKSY
jgi:alkylation response protein AidB-like acyl-CoA dehydrogenase